ncbi:4-hydroxythreonine-4-phosphate dehydrogenase PdxA [candidate division WOR-3 bacterium]|nr:4-hydroxythreonine-4-phosphate dehydrogenase PdxA [candidate division WOR-3 bacterium]
MGDPAGIGPEVVVKALAATGTRGTLVIGSRRVFERERRRAGTAFNPGLVDDSVPFPGRFRPGLVQENCGRAALAALERGAELLRQGGIAALVTAPVSKTALRLAGFGWPGQTEFLAGRIGARRPAMLAWTPRFKAVFVTIHLPLARVARRVTARRVAEKAELLDRFLQAESGRASRIGVMALNPHGEEFSLGEEERIRSGIALAREHGVDASGPWPADTAVGRRDIDGWVAMYHDQAMIPAKLLGPGVNVTLGLGRVRTSPLHGTAFDIAGRGIADPRSMIAAIRLARRLARLSGG